MKKLIAVLTTTVALGVLPAVSQAQVCATWYIGNTLFLAHR